MSKLAHPANACDDIAISDAEAGGRTVAHIAVDGACQCLCGSCNRDDVCVCPECNPQTCMAGKVASDAA